jgi:hypothetical protein
MLAPTEVTYGMVSEGARELASVFGTAVSAAAEREIR